MEKIKFYTIHNGKLTSELYNIKEIELDYNTFEILYNKDYTIKGYLLENKDL